jgi:hypothetical protein
MLTIKIYLFRIKVVLKKINEKTIYIYRKEAYESRHCQLPMETIVYEFKQKPGRREYR